MIVCWALFALGAVSALIGLAGYQNLVSRAESIELATHEEAMAAQPDSDRAEGNRIRWHPSETPESRKIRRDAENWIVPLGFGLGTASLMLIWNILWHVGHWIWMGRKE